MHAQRDIVRAAAQQAAMRGSRPVDPGGAAGRLQRRFGNRRAQRVVQAKLAVGRVDDPLEREADRISGLAMGQPVRRAPRSAQRAPEAVGHVHGAEGGVADTAVADAVARASGGGQAVPDGVRERMEQVSGADFSGVRVHVDAEADRLNDALGSRAFTVGSDVFVRRSEYRPGSPEGDALLGHELTHTIQQGAAPLSGESSVSSSIGSGQGAPTAQRLFGFEFEIGVPVFSRVGGKAGPPLTRAAKDDSRAEQARVSSIAEATDKSFKVKTDTRAELVPALPDEILSSNGSAPIIEIVTRPMDEFEKDADVANTVNSAVRFAEKLRTTVVNKNESVALDKFPFGLTVAPAGRNYVGYPVAAEHKHLLGVDAFVQATFGLSLKRVGAEFGSRAEDADSKIGVTYLRALSDSVKDADKVRTHLRDKIAPVPELSWDDEPGVLDELHGFIAMIAYYLETGKIFANAYDKGYRLPEGTLTKHLFGIFYYKTRLSTVRNSITDSSPLAARVLGSKTDRDLVVGVLQENIALDFTRKIYELKLPTWKEWLESVLAGKDDALFEGSANPYSEELVADDVGKKGARGHGMVVENRRFAQSEGFEAVNGRPHRYPPSKWLELAMNLKFRLERLHKK